MPIFSAVSSIATRPSSERPVVGEPPAPSSDGSDGLVMNLASIASTTDGSGKESAMLPVALNVYAVSGSVPMTAPRPRPHAPCCLPYF